MRHTKTVDGKIVKRKKKTKGKNAVLPKANDSAIVSEIRSLFSWVSYNKILNIVLTERSWLSRQ